MIVDTSPLENHRLKIIRLIFGKSDKTSVQLLKYSFVGGIAYVVDFGSLYLLTDFIKINYLVSAAVAFLLGLLTNYFLSILFVFPTRTLKSRSTELLVFTIIGAVGLGLNELIIWGSTEGLGLHYLVSKVISTIVVFFWNFFARKKILFS